MTEHSRNKSEMDDYNCYEERFDALHEAKKDNRIVLTDEATGEVILDVDEDRAIKVMLSIAEQMVMWAEPMQIRAHIGGVKSERVCGPNWRYNKARYVYEYKPAKAS